MKRLLLLLGSVLSIGGALGLALFGSAIVGAFEGVLTYRIVDPPEPLPASFGELKWVAISGVALAFGLVASCVVMVLCGSQKTMSLAGKVLHVVAGFLISIGTLPLLWSLLIAKKAFNTIATSETTSSAESMQRMLQTAVPTFTVGCVILVVGTVILLVAGQMGVRTKPSQAIGTRLTLGMFAATGSLLLGAVSSLLFIVFWFHGIALETFLTDTSSVPQVTKLAEHLAGLLNMSLLAFLGIGAQGIVQAVAAILASSSRT